MHISRYMNPETVIFLEAVTRDEALDFMVHEVYRKFPLKDEEEFLTAIKNREKIVSTGIGMGIAIPHAKLSSYDDFFIAVGILKKPVDWNSLDKAPVRFVFMIGGPDDKQTEYLQLLSGLTRLLKNEERRRKLSVLHDPVAIVELFQSI